MRIISVSNNKGGVGKTTSTVNIAAALQLKGNRVLVIDLDHQAQATYHLGYNPKQIKKSIYHVLKGELPFDEILINRNGPCRLSSGASTRTSTLPASSAPCTTRSGPSTGK